MCARSAPLCAASYANELGRPCNVLLHLAVHEQTADGHTNPTVVLEATGMH
jgi:hypothetical protein